MWNDRYTPIAYLVTFRCYGTWLHGDKRGAVNKFNNKYQSPFLKTNTIWETENKNKLKSEPVTLNAEQRKIVEQTIREVCKFKNWVLHAVNVITNHVHTVVSTGNRSAGSALNAFKSYSTRKLKEENCWNFSHSPWSDKGNNRYLWNEKSLESAIEYVVSGQGSVLQDFD